MTSGPSSALEHVHAGDAQAHDLGGAHRGALVLRVELDDLGRAAAVHVAAELVALRAAAHGGDHAVADDERADVLALALGDERWISTFCCVLCSVSMIASATLLGGEDDADALGALRAA